jgi:hypothetical protein
MLSHVDLPSNVVLLYRLFVEIVEVQQPAIGAIFYDVKVACVGSIVPNIELVIVHCFQTQK